MAAAVLLAAAPGGAVSGEADAAFLFALGQSLRHEGSYTEALEMLTAAAEADPDEPFLRLELADFLLQLGRLDEALQHAEDARTLAPEDPAVLGTLAKVQLRRADRVPAALEDARSAFEEIRRLEETNIEVRVTLGRLYLNLSRPVEARAPLREARQLRPGDRLVTSLLVQALEEGGDREAAEQELGELLAADEGFLPARLALARLLGRRGAFGAAVELLAAAPPENRDNGALLRELALGHYRTGSWPEALEVARRWLERRPDDTSARYVVGLSLAALDRHEEAEEVFAELVSAQPRNTDFIRALAEVVERHGRGEEAAALLREAAQEAAASGAREEQRSVLAQLIELHARAGHWERLLTVLEELPSDEDPAGSGEILLLRAEALRRLGRGTDALAELRMLAAETALDPVLRARTAAAFFALERPREAERALRPLLKAKDAEGLVRAAEVLHDAERYAATVDLLRRASRQRPADTEIMFWLAASLERQGKWQQAEAEFRRLLDLESEFAPALNYLGYMLAERGLKLEEALDLVQRAVAQDPDNGAYLDSLGWAYFQLGRLEEAALYLERAARIVGDDPIVLEHVGDLYRARGDLERATSRYREALLLGGENEGDLRRKLEALGRE